MEIQTGRWKYRIEEYPRSPAGCHCFDDMSVPKQHDCTNCDAKVYPESRNYRYAESGLSNVVLQGIDVAECPSCGASEVIIPKMARVHGAVARAILNSPARLTGEQLRFLRKHLGLTGDQLGSYLHTEKTKISKWENGEDRIGPGTDRLVRLLAASLDKQLRAGVSSVAQHLPKISDDSGESWELHVDVATLQTSFLRTTRAA